MFVVVLFILCCLSLSSSTVIGPGSNLTHELINANPGDTIELTNGLYFITTPAILRGALNIRGIGLPLVNCSEPFVAIQSDYDISISGIQFEHCGSALQFYGNKANIENCHFFSNSKSAVIADTTQLNISSSTFLYNSFSGGNGAGFYATNCSVNIVDTVFRNNTADAGGAGYFTGFSSVAYFRNVDAFGNTASSGGAFNFINISNATFHYCNFFDNYAIGQLGGAVVVIPVHDGILSFYSCSFFRNEALAKNGGAISSYVRLVVDNCTFSFNKASYGAAIHHSNKLGIFKNSNFTDGVATSYAGSMNIGLGIMKIDNCIFARNSAYKGGALYAVILDTGTTFQNNIFEDNRANSGSAIYNEEAHIQLYKNSFYRNVAQGSGTVYTDPKARRIISEKDTFINNVVTSGGAFYLSCYATISEFTCHSNRATDGGCIYGTQSVEITNSSLSHNIVSGIGGGISIFASMNDDMKQVIISGVEMRNNSANTGGAIHVTTAILTLTKSTFMLNYALDAAVLDLLQTNANNLIQDCNITDNSAIGAMIRTDTVLIEIDNTRIQFNTGAALFPLDTYLFIENSNLLNNTGDSMGPSASSQDMLIRNTALSIVETTVSYCCGGIKNTRPDGQICSYPFCTQTCKDSGSCACATTSIPARYDLGCSCSDSSQSSCQTYTCENGDGTCNKTADCGLQPGSFGGISCSCEQGFTRDNFVCVDINECSNSSLCYPGVTCTNLPGSFECGDCPPGYDGNAIGADGCVERNHCTDPNACYPGTNCINNVDGFNCTSCPSGLQGTAIGVNGCTDIDECTTLQHECNISSSYCNNTFGDYTCVCLTGFTGGPRQCIDINECVTDVCHPLVICTNTDGSYECGQCPAGYEGNGTGMFGCQEINYCNTTACYPGTVCSPILGGIFCGECPVGLEGTAIGVDGCQDIDECETQQNNCNTTTSYCNNTFTNFFCSCKPGFSLIGQNVCYDDNECLDPSACYPEVSCTNTDGSFECGPCPEGYQGNAIGINGCTVLEGACISQPCYPEVICTNVQGGYQCGQCPSGYTGDAIGINGCTDVNECEDPTICTNGICRNIEGTYECRNCPSGYTVVEGECSDINECLINHGNCDPRVTCENTPGNYICGRCPFGYAGNGYTGCYSHCGDSVCDPGLGEDCLTCSLDCRQISCRKCGDGLCEASLGETCSSCYEDCSSTCRSTCATTCVHGNCVNNTCVCTSPWDGPYCDDHKIHEVSFIPQKAEPAVSILSYVETRSKTKKEIYFKISVQQLIERDRKGNIVAQSEEFQYAGIFEVSDETIGETRNHKYTYSATLANNAVISITFIDFVEDANYEYLGKQTKYSNSTLKLNFKVARWPFQALTSTLDVRIFTENNSSFCFGSPVILNVTEEGNLKWMKFRLGNTEMLQTFRPESLVDGRIRNTKFTLVDSNMVTATFPHFWDSAEFDPDFTLLFGGLKYNSDEYTDECGDGIEDEDWFFASFLSAGQIAGITIGAIAIVILILGVAKYLHRRRRARRRIRKAQKNIEMERALASKNSSGSSSDSLDGNTSTTSLTRT